MYEGERIHTTALVRSSTLAICNIGARLPSEDGRSGDGCLAVGGGGRKGARRGAFASARDGGGEGLSILRDPGISTVGSGKVRKVIYGGGSWAVG